MPRTKVAEEAMRLLEQAAADPEIEEKRRRLRDETLLERERLANIKTKLELSRKSTEKTEVDRDDQIQSVIESVKAETGAVRFAVSRIETVPAGIGRWIGHLDTIEYESLEGEDIERYIRSRLGGGRYKVTIHGLDGRARHSFFRVIAGKSKPVNPDEEEDETTLMPFPDTSHQVAEVVKASMQSQQSVLQLMSSQMRESSDRQMEMMARIIESSKPTEKERIPWDKILVTIPALMQAFASMRQDKLDPLELMRIIQESGSRNETQMRALLDMYPAAMSGLMSTQTEMTSLLIEKMADKIMNPGSNEDQDPMTKMMDKIADMVPMFMAAKQMPTAAHIQGMAQPPGHEAEQIEDRDEVPLIEGPKEDQMTPEKQAVMLKKMRVMQFLTAVRTEILSESDPAAVAESYEQGFYALPKGFRDSIAQSLEESDVSIFIAALNKGVGEEKAKNFMSFVMEDLSRFEWIMEFLRIILSDEEESEDDGRTETPGEDPSSDRINREPESDEFGEHSGPSNQHRRTGVGAEEDSGMGREEREAHTQGAGDRAES